MRAILSLTGAIIAFSAAPSSAEQNLCEALKSVGTALASDNVTILKGDKITEGSAYVYYQGLMSFPATTDCEVYEQLDKSSTSYGCTFHLSSASTLRAKQAEIEQVLKSCFPKAQETLSIGGETLYDVKDSASHDFLVEITKDLSSMLPGKPNSFDIGVRMVWMPIRQ
jgi:hypothetical protein